MIQIAECKVGTPVWYQPSVTPNAPKFAAVVTEEPRMLGETTVCRIGELGDDYRQWCRHPTTRTHIAAAALFALSLRASGGKE